MKNFLAFIKLTRPINLVIIALTLFALRYWVLEPMLLPKGLQLLSSCGDFSILVLSVVCIAAGGNIINDYFDTKTDAINKPDRMIVGVVLDRRVALSSHGVLTFLGLFLAAYYGWITDSLRFVVLHVFVAISLWYYSTYFKRETPFGNFVIALLTGLVPMTIAFFDVFPLVKQVPEDVINELAEQGFSLGFYFKVILYWILGFSLFAFMGNLIRELYKDLADIEGDKKSGRRTIPIVWSEKGALWLVIGYVLIWVLGLLAAEYLWLDSTFTKIYLLVGLVLPMVLSAIWVFKNPKRESYKKASFVVKVVLFIGIAFSYFVKTIILG